MAVRWNQTQRRTVVHWRRILDSIGRRDVMAIASELNDLSALCERAREDAGNEAERCAHCIVFGNARRCVETRLKITEALLDGEMDEARAATMAVVAQIAGARPRDSV